MSSSNYSSQVSLLPSAWARAGRSASVVGMLAPRPPRHYCHFPTLSTAFQYTTPPHRRPPRELDQPFSILFHTFPAKALSGRSKRKSPEPEGVCGRRQRKNPSNERNSRLVSPRPSGTPDGHQAERERWTALEAKTKCDYSTVIWQASVQGHRGLLPKEKQLNSQD